ncbi:MAG: SET domain-containing protein-lysine N-methyltransferase [Kiritimatiellaeota bacterium]|nr:SET domain-containing protein-lysine N-methyltransferase [Kiritimatiellota bacterium]
MTKVEMAKLLRVAKSGVPGAGRGVFARVDIPKGTRVAEYTGVVCREADYAYEDEGDYVVLFSIGRGRVLDPRKGNASVARWINHSCEPNCAASQDGGRIFIEAERALRAGEELFYNYDIRIGRRPNAKDREKFVCRCGSPKCRGTMLHVEKNKAAKGAKKK